VEYGKPMWFQLWDAELTTTTDHLLSSKVTGLSSPYLSHYLSPYLGPYLTTDHLLSSKVTGHFCTHRTQIPDTYTDTPISIPSSTLFPGLYLTFYSFWCRVRCVHIAGAGIARDVGH